MSPPQIWKNQWDPANSSWFLTVPRGLQNNAAEFVEWCKISYKHWQHILRRYWDFFHPWRCSVLFKCVLICTFGHVKYYSAVFSLTCHGLLNQRNCGLVFWSKAVHYVNRKSRGSSHQAFNSPTDTLLLWSTQVLQLGRTTQIGSATLLLMAIVDIRRQKSSRTWN